MKQAILVLPSGCMIAGPAGAVGPAGADGGVFKLATGNVSTSGEAAALVGKCIAYVSANGWTGTHPASSTPSHYALVVGLAESVFTCVFLGFAGEQSRVVSVPSAMVNGGGTVESAVFIDASGDYYATLGTGTNLYYGETWTVLAVADGVTLLKKCYSAM